MSELVQLVAGYLVSLAKAANESAVLYSDAKQVKIRQGFDQLHHFAKATMKHLDDCRVAMVISRDNLRTAMEADSLTCERVTCGILGFDQKQADRRIVLQIPGMTGQFAEQQETAAFKPNTGRVTRFRSGVVAKSCQLDAGTLFSQLQIVSTRSIKIAQF